MKPIIEFRRRSKCPVMNSAAISRLSSFARANPKFLTSRLLEFFTSLVLLLAASVAHGGDSLFQAGVRSPRVGEIVYFLLPDRFNDGNPSNNRGGVESDAPEETGFNPANPDFFHGGDLQGISLKLDYLRDLGATSIWMSPIFRNRVVQTGYTA